MARIQSQSGALRSNVNLNFCQLTILNAWAWIDLPMGDGIEIEVFSGSQDLSLILGKVLRHESRFTVRFKRLFEKGI